MEQYMVVFWFIVMMVTLILELQSVDLTSIWFSAGAFVTMILSVFVPNVIIQFIVFIAVSTILIASVRPVLKKYFKGNMIHTNTDGLVGKKYILIDGVQPNGKGTISINGVKWTVVNLEGKSIEKGLLVKILAVEGNKFVVEESE